MTSWTGSAKDPPPTAGMVIQSVDLRTGIPRPGRPTLWTPCATDERDQRPASLCARSPATGRSSPCRSPTPCVHSSAVQLRPRCLCLNELYDRLVMLTLQQEKRGECLQNSTSEDSRGPRCQIRRQLHTRSGGPVRAMTATASSGGHVRSAIRPWFVVRRERQSLFLLSYAHVRVYLPAEGDQGQYEELLKLCRQLLARTARAAPGADPSAQTAKDPDHQGHCGFRN